MRSINSLLRLTIVGLAIVFALGDQSCSPRKPRNPHPEASGFQPKYSKSFDGQKLVFAVIGDWGRAGGEDAYDNVTLSNCIYRTQAYAANNSVPYTDDSEGNACGAIQQIQTAKLMDAVCADKECQFVVNTGDNFYVHGCYADNNTAVPWYLRCSARFQHDWEEIYNGPDTPYLRGLPWINSVGNHDILGNSSGIDAQIHYQSRNPNWILPARYYSAEVAAKSGPSIRFHVAHTSCFVGGYRKNTSDYYHTDELQTCSTEKAVTDQVNFLNMSLMSSTADYDIILAHHPALSTAGPSYFQADEATPVADGWTPLSDMVLQYQPVAYFNGHDHAMSYQYLDAPVYNDTGDNTTVLHGYPYTGFHTSGAGSWAQAGDGGYGLPMQYSFSKYSNVDLGRGVARGGFLIVTVDKCTFQVEYYSDERGKDPPFMVTTQNNGKPQTKLSPYAMMYDIVEKPDGSSVAFSELPN